MKKQLKNVIGIGSICLMATLASACQKDVSKLQGALTSSGKGSASPGTSTVASHAALAPRTFSLWGSCIDKAYLIDTTGICVPMASALECVTGGLSNPNDLGAQQTSGKGQTANSFQFYGCFKGSSNAPDGSNEMSVFVTDDITNWTGNEMGFTETLNDHTLKGYVQTPKPGGGTYPLDYKVLLTNDDGYHTFKCAARAGSPGTVDFYIDGTLVNTVSSSYTGHYYNNYDYFVGTTHRTSDGWSASGQQIEMYSLSVN